MHLHIKVFSLSSSRGLPKALPFCLWFTSLLCSVPPSVFEYTNLVPSCSSVIVSTDDSQKFTLGGITFVTALPSVIVSNTVGYSNSPVTFFTVDIMSGFSRSISCLLYTSPSPRDRQKS